MYELAPPPMPADPLASAVPIPPAPPPPLLLALACACGSVRRASRAITRAYAWQLRNAGLNPTRFTLLQALDRMGPTTPRALGQALAIQPSTLSRSLRPLERRGWVRAQRGKGQRVIRWEITTTGLIYMVRATHAWNRVQRDMRYRLDDDAWIPLARRLALLTFAAQAVFADW